METNISPKVSVIIPVYNVERYLHQCLESVVSQTLNDIEIIIVNDGSTDNSLEIINRFAQKDNRIKVISQENGGYAKAVNKGLSIACGEYIAEIDSDDYINLNMYSKLYDIAIKNDIDIVAGRYAEFVGKDQTFKMFPISFVPEQYENRKLSVEEIYKDNKLELLGFTAIWSAIYKRSLIVDHDIKLNENVKCYNDNGFWFRTRAVAKSIYYDSEIMYFYRVDVAGQTIKKMNERYPMLIDEFEDIKCQYQKMGIWKENANFWFRHLVNNVLYFVLPKIETRTMAPFINAVKSKIISFRKKEKLLPGTIDDFAYNLINILETEGTDKFLSEYIKSRYKVSVIMATYNGARFLDSTIPQILNQTLKDIELILVNDGSTDESLQIMQKYQYDFRVRIINLEKNKGQSGARNEGFKHAIGQYVIFLDCDDEFNHELLGKLYWHMNEYKLDICMTGYTVHNCRNYKEYSNYFSDFPNEVFAGASLDSQKFNQIVGWNWDKMYRREFLLENALLFPEDMHISEDALVAYPAVLLAKRMFVLKESLITYNEFGSNSVSSKMDRYIDDNFKYYDRMYEFLDKHNLLLTHEKHFINMFVNHSIFSFTNLIKTENGKINFFDKIIGECVEKFKISSRLPMNYFDNDYFANEYKILRRMMKYKPGQYKQYLSDLESIPLELDDYKFGYEFENKNIIIFKQEKIKDYAKWSYAFDAQAKSATLNWVNLVNIYLLNKDYQDSYLKFEVTLLKNNSIFITDELEISATSFNKSHIVNMFNWSKNSKLSNMIGYTLNDGVLKLFAKFSGAYDALAIETKVVESRDDDLPKVEFNNKRFLEPKDFIELPTNLEFALNVKKPKNKSLSKRKQRKPSLIRFLLNKNNRRRLMNKLMAYIKE